MPDDSIQVVLLGRGYSLKTDKLGGQKGTKIFHEASFNPSPAGVPVSLPTIGDSFSDEADKCLAVDIEMVYLNDSTTCGRIWTINYENDITEPDIEVVSPNEEDLQTTIEVGCEQISFEPPANTWKWWTAGTDIYIKTQPIFYRINTAVIKVYRTIWDNKLADFMKINFATIGHLNSDLFWDVPQFMLLYEGSNLQETRDDQGNKIWKAEMVFNFRTVTGNFTMGSADDIEGGKDGWNWVLQLNADMTNSPWNKPYRDAGAGHKFLYENADFATLLTAAGKPVTFPDLNWME